MIPKLSVCCFIKDTFEGAFCLWESMAQLMPFADEYIVMDLGSTDGTLETLEELARLNPRIRIVHSTFHTLDASIFATLANDVIALCRNDLVLYHQADEIWHEALLACLRKDLEEWDELGLPVDWKGLSFWRYQLRDNFQKIKWFPHVVNRLDWKHRFNFVGDGMNTDRVWDPPLCGMYDGGWFPKWGERYKDCPEQIPTREMVLDVSLVGGFRDNIVARKEMHRAFWHEELLLPIYNEDNSEACRIPADEWAALQAENPNWTKTDSPFQIPEIMRGLVGATKYHLRPEIFDRIAFDKGLNA